MVAELGSGNGKKTRWLLEALRARHNVTYFPIDISPSALARSCEELGALEGVRVAGLERTYLDGLREAAARRDGQNLLVLFLGSTIGNFDPPADEQFLRCVRGLLAPGDALLLATDLVKPVEQTLAAYDDSLGVTAAFNLNLLARINRELDSDFDLTRFRHLAVYNREHDRVEMYLRSLEDQCVHIRALGLAVRFQEGETIWTENSHKYTVDRVQEMASRAGFTCAAHWVDQEWPFAQSLLKVE
jgi:dimethylhistidine N-methyltransferase